MEITDPNLPQPPTELQQQILRLCIDACHACARVCNHCAASCLQEQDVKMMARCIALDVDCAAVCALTAGVLARQSEQAMAVCRLCVQMCRACGAECSQHTMAHCQECAEACMQCAAQCDKLLAME